MFDDIKKVFKKKKEPSKQTPLAVLLFNSLLPTLCAIAYLCMGFFGGLWHPGWLIFLLIPLYFSFWEAYNKRNPNYFAYPVLAVGAYLLAGFSDETCWVSCLVLFATVPLYYLIIYSVRKKNLRAVLDFSVPIFCVAVYLLLGFLGGYWHPGWVVFFAIPLYYQTVSAVKKYNAQKRGDDGERTEVETMSAEEYQARKDREHGNRWY